MKRNPALMRFLFVSNIMFMRFIAFIFLTRVGKNVLKPMFVKNIKLFLLSFLLVPFISFSQLQRPFNYKFSQEIDSIVKVDSFPWTSQTAAWDFSLIGKYENSLREFDKDFEKANPTDWHTKILQQYTPLDAVDFIVKEAMKNRIIIINEAHHYPRHRVFVQMLLPKLKEIGYTYIGFEALHYDSMLVKRGFPEKTTNVYENEPNFGNLIRESLKLGYTPFAYEAGKDSSGRQLNLNPREIAQAKNINKIFEKNSTAKFIIFCGYDHANEDSVHKKNWDMSMAGRLKQITGIDPLTIDQVKLSEHSSKESENPFRQLMQYSYSAVLTDVEGHLFNKADTGMDINVYHPNSKYINNRPDWLYSRENKSVSIASKIKISFPCLVFAYKLNDNITTAIPVDIIELESKMDKTPLLVKKGEKYRIIVKNKNGLQQQIEIE